MKTEPTVGVTVGNFLINAASFATGKLNHEALVSDALDAFTKAEAKVEAAISKIDADIVAKEAEVALIQGQILGAGESKSKLARVRDRIKAFTA